MLNDAQGHRSEMPVTFVLMSWCCSTGPFILLTPYTANCIAICSFNLSPKPELPGVLGSKTKQHLANDLQFLWYGLGPRRPRLNPCLRWKVSPSMLLSAPKVTAVHPRMVPWFLGISWQGFWLKSRFAAFSAKTQRLVSNAWLSDQSAAKYPSRLNGMEVKRK